MHEKRGIIEPGRTPPAEAEKVAKAQTKKEQVERLDDDFTKRAADIVTNMKSAGK